MRRLVLVLALVAVPLRLDAAVAFDAISTSLRTGTTDPHTWTHTPTGTPRGVLCGMSHGVTATSHAVSATYGGVAMAFVRRQTDTATEPGVAELWFLGASLPTGAQTVSFDLDSGTTDDIQFSCVTVTAATDTEVGAQCSNPQNSNEANPTCTGNPEASTTHVISGIYYTGADAATTCAGGATTAVVSTDHGAFRSKHCRSDALTASTATCTHTVAADDQALVCGTVIETSTSVLLDAVASGSAATSSSLSWSHPTTINTNRILFVFVGGWDGTGRSATATYGGTPMTEASVTALSAGNDILWVFRLAAPATGTNTIAVTITGGTMHLIGGSLSFFGAHQTDFATPAEAVSSMAGTTSSVASVASAAGDMIADGVITGANNTHIAAGAASHTEKYDVTLGASGEAGAGGQTDGSASGQNIDWTISSSSNWAATAVWVKAVGGGGGPPPAPKRLLTLGVGD